MGRKEQRHRARRAARSGEEAAPRPAHRDWTVLIGGLLVVFAGAVAYGNSLGGAFVYDDIPGIVKNSTIRSLWPPWRPLFPPGSGTPVQGRPIANLSLAINYALGGLHVFGYHLVNLLVHLLAGLTLLAIVHRTVAGSEAARRIAGSAAGIATAVALLWVVHPLSTAAVTATVQRTESMMSLFYLLTLYCVIRSDQARPPSLWGVAAVGACALGMGTKEVMASAPVVVLAYDAIFLAGSLREALRRRIKLYLGLAATWAILIGLMAANHFARGTSAGFGAGLSLFDYLRTQCWAILHYLRLSIIPTPLVLDYGTGLVRSSAQVVPGALVVGALILGTIVALARVRWLGFLGLWFLAILAPSSSFVPLVTETVAEKRMYLALAAVVTLVVVVVHLAWGRLLGPAAWASARGGQRFGWVLPVATASVACVFTVTTRARNAEYKDGLTIWRDTVAKMPRNVRAHADYAVSLRREGRFSEAIAQDTEAIELAPTLADAYYNRGLAYESAREPGKALADYTKAIALDPGLAEAYNNRGTLYGTMGQYEQALGDLSKAAELRPNDPEAYVNRGSVNLLLGRAPQAVADFTRALEIRPSDPDVLRARAMAALAAGDSRMAQEDAAECARLGRPPDARFEEMLQRALASRR